MLRAVRGKGNHPNRAVKTQLPDLADFSDLVQRALSSGHVASLREPRHHRLRHLALRMDPASKPRRQGATRERDSAGSSLQCPLAYEVEAPE